MKPLVQQLRDGDITKSEFKAKVKEIGKRTQERMKKYREEFGIETTYLFQERTQGG